MVRAIFMLHFLAFLQQVLTLQLFFLITSNKKFELIIETLIDNPCTGWGQWKFVQSLEMGM